MEGFDKHTLLIPTFNRPKMLEALLTHLCASPLRIMILDSSRQADKEANQRLVTFFPAVKYFGFSPEINMINKLLEGFRHVQTPFVSLLADDDIVFPEGLVACVQKLEQAQKAVAAQGIYLRFFYHQTFPHHIKIDRQYGCESLQACHSQDRLIQLLCAYEPTIYAVYRTEILKEIFFKMQNLYKHQQVEGFLFLELFQAIASVLIGDVLRIPEIYYGRRGPFEAHKNSHPAIWMSEDPTGFFQAYLLYRQFAIDMWEEYDQSLGTEEKKKWLDIAHYLFFHKDVKPFQIYQFNPRINNYGRNHRESHIPISGSCKEDRRKDPIPISRTNNIREYLWEGRLWRRPIHHFAKAVRKIADIIAKRAVGKKHIIVQVNDTVPKPSSEVPFQIQLETELENYRKSPSLMEGIRAIQDLVKLNVQINSNRNKVQAA